MNDVTKTATYFVFNDTATTEIYTLSLHDALPIWRSVALLGHLGSNSFVRFSLPGELHDRRLHFLVPGQPCDRAYSYWYVGACGVASLPDDAAMHLVWSDTAKHHLVNETTQYGLLLW